MKNNNWILPITITGLAIHTFNNKIFSLSKEKLRKKELKQRVYNWKFGTISYKKYGSLILSEKYDSPKNMTLFKSGILKSYKGQKILFCPL